MSNFSFLSSNGYTVFCEFGLVCFGALYFVVFVCGFLSVGAKHRRDHDVLEVDLSLVEGDGGKEGGGEGEEKKMKNN